MTNPEFRGGRRRKVGRSWKEGVSKATGGEMITGCVSGKIKRWASGGGAEFREAFLPKGQGVLVPGRSSWVVQLLSSIKCIRLGRSWNC